MSEPYRHHSPLLICGAGPTGLVLALWLARRKVPFRIIDKAAHAGTASRALVVQARTLEFYRQLGIEQRLIDDAQHVDSLHFWVRQKEKGMARLGGAATDISAFPFFLVYPQDEHEALLERELARLGIRVERSTELVGFGETPTGIDARLRDATGKIELFHTDYLAGCDGARSIVRDCLGVGFAGGTYQHTFYVADVVAAGPIINGDLNLALDDADFLAIFPMKGEGRVRLIGTVNSSDTNRTWQWQDVSQDIFRRVRLDVKRVNWFSTYRVHHRVAGHFRRGRAFLLGDAAHVHSPVGGQGMNTGIGDAVNLAWKLDAVLQHNAPLSILDTYGPERIPFARSLVHTTDRVFAFVNKRGRLAATVRTRIFPLVLPALFNSATLRRAAFRLISQTRINYRSSPLSTGATSRLRAGDRLPWIKSPDNHAPLASLDWQLHSYGGLPDAAICFIREGKLPHFVFPALKRIPAGTVCLIRPDGHLGWIGRGSDLEGLAAYIAKWRVDPGNT